MKPGYYWFVGQRVESYIGTFHEGWEDRTHLDEPIQVFENTHDSSKGLRVLDFDGGMEHATSILYYEGVFIPIERPDEKIFEAQYGRIP